MIKRSPIIHRIPVVTRGQVFQTIASASPDYKNAQIMGTYPTIESARYHYPDDMAKWRKEHGPGSVWYAIRPTTLE